MADQVAMRILFLGPAPGDDDNVVVTAELSCGCEITRSLSESRIRGRAGGGQTIAGQIPCPKGHPSPPWVRNRGQSMIARALGRT